MEVFLGTKKKSQNLIGCFADIDGFSSVVVRVTRKHTEIIDEFSVLDRKSLKISSLAQSLSELARNQDAQCIGGNATARTVYEKANLPIDWQTTEFDIDKISFILQSHLNEGLVRFDSAIADQWEKEFRSFNPAQAKEGVFSRRIFALFHALTDLKVEDFLQLYLVYGSFADRPAIYS